MSRRRGSAYDGCQRADEPPRDLRWTSRQSTIEWLALMAMLVALAGVLVTTMPGLAHTIADAFGKLINSVLP